MQSPSWETLGSKKHRLESRLPGEISITSDMQMTPPYGRKWRKTKKPLDESERGKWKSWIKAQHSKNKDHGIQSHHFMQIDGETVETVADFIFWGSKISADGDCSHEIKRCLLLGRKVMTNLDCILKKQRHRWLRNTWKDAQHHSLSEKCKSKPQWGTITHQSGWLLSKSLQAINAGEGVEKREPSYTVGGNAN